MTAYIGEDWMPLSLHTPAGRGNWAQSRSRPSPVTLLNRHGCEIRPEQEPLRNHAAGTAGPLTVATARNPSPYRDPNVEHVLEGGDSSNRPP